MKITRISRLFMVLYSQKTRPRKDQVFINLCLGNLIMLCARAGSNRFFSLAQKSDNQKYNAQLGGHEHLTGIASMRS